MKTEITTDLEKATFTAKRTFNASINLVWKVYTESQFLDQWWAPRPWKCETKSLDFQVNGKWIYDMVGPNGERHGAIQIFEEIKFEDFFAGKDAFLNEAGEINEEMPVAKWKNTFIVEGESTTVICTAIYPNKEALETVINMGMAQGVAMAHDNAEELLNTLVK